jgi:hypothetical protein
MPADEGGGVMATCKDCVHVEVCREYVEGLAAARGVRLSVKELDSVLECDDCKHFKDRSQFVELPFEQNKGASPFDKVAHTTYTLATESHRVASFTIEGYYLMYNEERLYTLEKDGIVILVQGSSPHDVVEKAKLAIEKLSKERESNA